ncbi:MAG: hypothetical protein V1875_02330 [Candidatus Altiarchaeota archaeon]
MRVLGGVSCKNGCLFAVMAVYLIAFLLAPALMFDARNDERFFWPSVLAFSSGGVMPDIEALRGYSGKVSGVYPTPLVFYLFSLLERTFGFGVSGARATNFLVSFAVACIVARGCRFRPLVGLFLFPYFWLASAYAYTDMVASFFVLCGFLAYERGKGWVSGLFFVLAVSSRQFMVCFPAAIAAWELFSGSRRRLASAAPHVMASMSLLGWYLLFGGFGPPGLSPKPSMLGLHPEYSLFLLSMVGLYYVLVESLLFGFGWLRRPRKSVVPVMVVLFALFVSFPPYGNPGVYPIKTMGIFDTFLAGFAGEPLRIAAYYMLAALAVLRFQRLGLPSLMVCFNCLVVAFSFIIWEKYALPLIIVLWYMASRGYLADADAKHC